MDVFDAAELYKKAQQQVIVLAGKDYGSGSSRDWAAKGPWMLVSSLTPLSLPSVVHWLYSCYLYRCKSCDIFSMKCVECPHQGSRSNVVFLGIILI